MNGLESFSYHLPTRIHFGVGLFSTLAKLIEPLECDSCLVVTSPGFPKRHGEELESFLNAKKSILFDQVNPSPSISKLEEYRETLRGHNCDMVIGIGGGSVMDMAKVLSLALNHTNPLGEVVADPNAFVPRSKKLVLLPTTSGTASEVTPWATIWDFEKQRKLSLSHPKLFADMAVIDPSLCVGMSPEQTAITGMDTLSHCLETLWSKKGSHPMTEIFAQEALELVLIYLPQAVERPTDLEAREAMAKACFFAGLAFSQTRTAAAHSISYPLTLLYQIPHGTACSITLPALLVENARSDSSRLLKIAQLLGADSVVQGGKVLKTFMRSLGVPTCLSELGITEKDIDIIAQNSVTKGRMDNNIRELTPADVKRLLESIV